jgi:hypothetical protein
MAVTSVKTPRSAARAAAKRRALYLVRIEQAENKSDNQQFRFRYRLWVVQGWLMSEARLLDPARQERLLAGQRAIAELLNERKGGGRLDPDRRQQLLADLQHIVDELKERSPR